MSNFLKKIFNPHQGIIQELSKTVAEINALEPEIEKFSDQELKEESRQLKERVAGGEDLEAVLVKAFALVREASKRTLKQRHFDVQLMAGIVLHQGKIAEMLTGEGKTLAATLAAYLNALANKGVHIVTVNDYLAQRDTVWMGQIYDALGLSVGCLSHESAYIYDFQYQPQAIDEKDKERDVLGGFKVVHEFLRPVSRKEAYSADILYGTNSEFGFDYLRDNMVYSVKDQAQARENSAEPSHHYAIIDEVDSILIDEARTPLIIVVPDRPAAELYKAFAKIVQKLNAPEDYTIDEKLKAASITETGIEKVEKMLGIKNLYDPENFRLVHYLEESLRAKALFFLDRDYVVKNGEVIIVDEFTGRMLFGRRFSGGLHQAIEAKESVAIKEESKILASITIQNYFRMYKKLAGMTGTAQTSAEEFHKVYNLEVISIPTNRPMIRKELPDLIFKTTEGRYSSLVKEVKERHQKGQPMLIGTTSVEKNEYISRLLHEAGIKHEILNAKNHEREGAIIAQAGSLGAITVATNMAGRGVDIILGGNPQDSEQSRRICELGGLHIIGTERHDARRIDNQLRGRGGRQGDPGSSQFFLSLEDDLVRIFGGDRLKSIMETLKVPEDMPISAGIVSRAISEAQAKVEGINFDARKYTLEFDDVLNKQRQAVYNQRQKIISGNADQIWQMVEEFCKNQISRIVANVSQMPSVSDWPLDDLSSNLIGVGILDSGDQESLAKEKFINSHSDVGRRDLEELILNLAKRKIEELKPSVLPEVAGVLILRILDMLWMDHLENMEALRESVRIRAYGQRDPLVEYRREGHRLFQDLFSNFEGLFFSTIFRKDWYKNVAESSANKGNIQPAIRKPGDKIGRNDPCPCGATHSDGRPMKYKHCHGKNV